MASVRKRSLPAAALLARYAEQDAYTDCYVTEIKRAIALSDYIAAFYSTPLFRLERLLIKWFAGLPSTQQDVQALADAATESFSAWHVEARATEQLLLTDVRGNTRSWLMIEALNHGTRLYFGSAVIPRSVSANGKPQLSMAFRILLPFHWIYSRALLASARMRLARG